MGIYKFGTSVALTVSALGFAGIAHANFVKTVSSEAECTAQDGTVMDLNGTQHCLVPVISPEFQKIEYAGELRGVTTCTEENTRKTQIGDFCLIALEDKPAVKKPAQTTSSMTDKMMDMAKDEAEKAAKDKAKKKMMDAFKR